MHRRAPLGYKQNIGKLSGGDFLMAWKSIALERKFITCVHAYHKVIKKIKLRLLSLILEMEIWNEKKPNLQPGILIDLWGFHLHETTTHLAIQIFIFKLICSDHIPYCYLGRLLHVFYFLGTQFPTWHPNIRQIRSHLGSLGLTVTGGIFSCRLIYWWIYPLWLPFSWFVESFWVKKLLMQLALLNLS